MDQHPSAAELEAMRAEEDGARMADAIRERGRAHLVRPMERAAPFHGAAPTNPYWGECGCCRRRTVSYPEAGDPGVCPDCYSGRCHRDLKPGNVADAHAVPVAPRSDYLPRLAAPGECAWCGEQEAVPSPGCVTMAAPAFEGKPNHPRSEPPRYTPGQLVLVTLRHRETGRRGEVREYEQVRLGEVRPAPPVPLAGYVRVVVPGVEDDEPFEVPARDLADAGVGCR